MPITILDWFNEWELKHWKPADWKTAWGPRPTAAPQGIDLHIIRGATSRALRPEMLFWEHVSEFVSHVFHEGDSKLTTEPNKLVSLEFLPRLTPTPALGKTGDVLEGLGIKINTRTGEVEAVKPAPTGRLVRNFILDAVAKVQRSATETVTLNKRAVRVHIYDKLVDAWITPSKLTVHKGSPIRATILASFSLDGEPDPPLVGDITHLTGITWTSTDASVTFTKLGEIKTTKTGTFMISAKLPVSWGSKVISSEIEVVDAWADKPNIRAKLIAGPGSARVNDIPNLLVIPDGFTAAQEADFDTIVVEAFDDMMKSLVSSPFDLFLNKGAINVWSLFMPSRQAGASAIYESYTFERDGKTIAQQTGLAYNPPATGVLEAYHLEIFAGLPVRGDAIPEAATTAVKEKKWKDKLEEWSAIFGTVSAARVPFDKWVTWTAHSTRLLLDEVDTAFGIAFGARPEISNYTTDNVVTNHPLRTPREHLDPWLARITDDNGPVIGHVWVGDAKDSKYIVALLGGAREGGAEGGVAAASLGNDPQLEVTRIGSGPRHTIVPFELPRNFLGGLEMDASTRGTIVHELAHAFGLQDEYSDLRSSANGASFPTVGNVQPIEELIEKPAPATPPPGDGLVGNKLRWRAPRIARAGVADGDIVKTGADEFRIPLRKGHKALFNKDDKVFLRQRPLRGTVIVGTGAAKHSELKLATISVPLRVLGVVQATEHIMVTADGATFDPKPFNAAAPFQSIVFVPVPPPPDAAAANEPWADLVPLVVRQHITKTGLPLDRSTNMKCADHNALDGYDFDSRQQIRNVPTNVKFHWMYSWVGAFDGGARFGCGIFHPSPICAMNHSTQRYDNERGTFHRIAPFCPVCSYLLTDAIDPSLHGEVDAIYAVDYVEAQP